MSYFQAKTKKLLGTETIKSAITESIPELEDIYKKNQFVRAKIFERKGYEDKNHQTNIVIYSNKIHGVIESVRTSILQWAMDLEEIDVHIEKKGLRGSVWVQSGVFG